MEHPDSEFDHLNPEGAGKLTPVSCKQVLWVTSGHSWVLHREDYFRPWYCHMGGFPGGSDSKESAHNAGDPGLIPGLGRVPGEGNGNPLHYSCQENSMDKGQKSPLGRKEIFF